MFEDDRSPMELVAAMGLARQSDTQVLEPIVRRAMAANEGAVLALLEGKQKASGVIFRDIMKETRGKADGDVVGEILTRLLEERRTGQ